MVIALSIIIALILRKNKIIKTRKIGILICFAIGANLVIIPLVNEYHVIIANILWQIIIIYEIYQVLEPMSSIKQINISLKIISIIIIISGSKLYIKDNVGIKDKNDIFFGSILEKEQKDEIEQVTKYIKAKQKEGKDVKILSTGAMFYTLNLGIDNWYFDLPLKGNMGKDGEVKAINQIHTLKNTIMLIEVESENHKLHYQFMDNVKKYVENNYQKIDQITNYDVYQIG